MLWPWLSVGVLLLAASAIALAGRGSEGAPDMAADVGQEEGALVPEHTAHDFGQVPMSGGNIGARFPLMVESPIRVTRLETT
jgi:hypothetical protein